MSKENIEVVQKLFEAVERRDLAGVLAAYDENIVIREAEGLPYGGEYHGLEGAQRHAYGYVQAWGSVQTEDEQKWMQNFSTRAITWSCVGDSKRQTASGN